MYSAFLNEADIAMIEHEVIAMHINDEDDIAAMLMVRGINEMAEAVIQKIVNQYPNKGEKEGSV